MDIPIGFGRMGVTDRPKGATHDRVNGATLKWAFWVSDRTSYYGFSPPLARAFLGFSGSGLGARKLLPSRTTR